MNIGELISIVHETCVTAIAHHTTLRWYKRIASVLHCSNQYIISMLLAEWSVKYTIRMCHPITVNNPRSSIVYCLHLLVGGDGRGELLLKCHTIDITHQSKLLVSPTKVLICIIISMYERTRQYVKYLESGYKIWVSQIQVGQFNNKSEFTGGK